MIKGDVKCINFNVRNADIYGRKNYLKTIINDQLCQNAQNVVENL